MTLINPIWIKKYHRKKLKRKSNAFFACTSTVSWSTSFAMADTQVGPISIPKRGARGQSRTLLFLSFRRQNIDVSALQNNGLFYVQCGKQYLSHTQIKPVQWRGWQAELGPKGSWYMWWHATTLPEPGDAEAVDSLSHVFTTTYDTHPDGEKSRHIPQIERSYSSCIMHAKNRKRWG